MTDPDMSYDSTNDFFDVRIVWAVVMYNMIPVQMI